MQYSLAESIQFIVKTTIEASQVVIAASVIGDIIKQSASYVMCKHHSKSFGIGAVSTIIGGCAIYYLYKASGNWRERKYPKVIRKSLKQEDGTYAMTYLKRIDDTDKPHVPYQQCEHCQEQHQASVCPYFQHYERISYEDYLSIICRT